MKSINNLLSSFTLALFVTLGLFFTSLNAGTIKMVMPGNNSNLAAGGGEGYYIEYKMTAKAGTGSIKTYSLDGNSRTETEMQIVAMQGKPMTSVTIMRKDAPNTIYTLNETEKTYSEMPVNKNAAAKPKTEQDYEITVLGKEKVNDYNCTHVKILYKSTNKTMEMWTSPDVSNYAYLKNVKNKYIEGSEFFKALDAKGASGFPVRIMSSESKGGQFQMDLIKAEKRSIDSSIFSLDGYKKTESASSGFDSQKIQQLKNMTPEERQKYIQDLQNQTPH